MSHDDLESSPPSEGVVETWRRVVGDPRGFFATMPEVGGLGEPTVFLAACAGVNAIGHFLVSWSIGGMIATFIGQILLGYAAAAVLTIIAQQLFGGKAGFEPTFRVVAYGLAPSVFFWIPRIAVLAWLWAWYLRVIGVERVHDVDATRAVLAVGLGVIVIALIGAGLRGGM